MKDKKYPPLVPEKSTSKPMGALARRAEKERLKKEEELKKSMKVDIPLDPDIDWIIKNINGKNYLSVK